MSKESKLPAHREGLPIAVDAMGGDHGLRVTVEGAVQAFREFGSRSILIGPEDDLNSALDGLGARDFPIEVRHAPQVITMDDQPVRAVRRKPDSSLCVAYKLLEYGEACAVLSAGNTGAMMAAGRLICGLLPGIERPAIASLIPVAGNSRPNVILDCGANVDCHAQNLVQFAVMGAIYYGSLFEGARPTVALLSNGTESSKGTDIIRAASMILSQVELIDYVGYVEGRDVTTKRAEVIVCDGFVGNVTLKAMEGCVRLIFKQLVHESRKGFFSKLGMGLSKSVYQNVFAKKFDYTEQGGAPLLGLTRLALVLHGSSDSRAVKNAIRLADSFVAKKMTEKISVALTQLEESMPEVDEEILAGVFGKGGDYDVRAKVGARSDKKSKNPNGAKADSARSKDDSIDVTPSGDDGGTGSESQSANKE